MAAAGAFEAVAGGWAAGGPCTLALFTQCCVNTRVRHACTRATRARHAHGRKRAGLMAPIAQLSQRPPPGSSGVPDYEPPLARGLLNRHATDLACSLLDRVAAEPESSLPPTLAAQVRAALWGVRHVHACVRACVYADATHPLAPPLRRLPSSSLLPATHTNPHPAAALSARPPRCRASCTASSPRSWRS